MSAAHQRRLDARAALHRRNIEFVVAAIAPTDEYTAVIVAYVFHYFRRSRIGRC